jgi:hypothetical protein
VTAVAIAALSVAAILAVSLSVVLYWWRDEVKQGKTARDMIDSLQERAALAESNLRVQEMANKATVAELNLIRDQLGLAQAQRNEALRDAREWFASQLEKTDAPGVADVLKRLLSEPLPGVSDVPTVRRSDQDPSADGLLDPSVLGS